LKDSKEFPLENGKANESWQNIQEQHLRMRPKNSKPDVRDFSKEKDWKSGKHLL